MEPISHDKIIDLRKVKKDEKSPAKPLSSAEEPRKPEYKTGSVLYKWEAPEFTKYEKDPYWKLILIISSLAIAIFLILAKNYLGALVIALLASLVYIYAFKNPKIINFAITPRGIQINEKLHKFEDLKSFWIFYEPPELKEISVVGKKTLSAPIYIPLGKANPVEIRRILLDFISEKKQEEPIANILARRLRF